MGKPSILGLVSVLVAGWTAWGASNGVEPAAKQDTRPTGVSGDWLTKVQKDTSDEEYQITWQEKTALPDVSGGYSAPNRAHNLRTYFTDEGPRMIRRDAENFEWAWGLEFTGIGGCDVQVPPEDVDNISCNGNRIELQRGKNLIEWYVNSDKGIEQGFTVVSNPANEDTLAITMEVWGNLTPGLMPDGETVEFVTSGGVGVIHYGQLKAVDARRRGRILIISATRVVLG